MALKKAALVLTRALLPALLACGAPPAGAGRQFLILGISEPLREENIPIRVPGVVKAAGGKVEDLTYLLALAPSLLEKPAGPAGEGPVRLGLKVRFADPEQLDLLLSLPRPGHFQIWVLDFYGKETALLGEGRAERGMHSLQYPAPKQHSGNGIRFLALKLDGRIVFKQALARVK